VILAAVAAVFASGGCDQIAARRQIQQGNKLYNEGRFAEAADVYEKALKRAPDIEIGQHNAALANFRAHEPGADTKANKLYATRAAAHFETYLKTQPGDARMISLLTTLWLDSGQFERAIEYWGAELAKNPKDRDVLRQMAGINLAAGRHDKAVEWILKRVEFEEGHEAKVNAYLDIAKIQWSLLRKPELVDADRLRAADVGLAALQKAEKLEPHNGQVQSYLGSLYELRKLGHGADWAQTVDAASERFHKVKWMELQKAAAAAPQSADGAKAAPAAKPEGEK